MPTVTDEFERIRYIFTDDEVEDLTSLLSIYMNNLREPTEKWIRLLDIISE